jgi:hypothetical protein
VIDQAGSAIIFLFIQLELKLGSINAFTPLTLFTLTGGMSLLYITTL